MCKAIIVVRVEELTGRQVKAHATCKLALDAKGREYTAYSQNDENFVDDAVNYAALLLLQHMVRDGQITLNGPKLEVERIHSYVDRAGEQNFMFSVRT